MTHIRKLKGITPDQARVLEENGIDTVEQLWICVGKGESEIKRVSTLLGISRNSLIALLTIEGLKESRSLGDSWLVRRWLDLTLLFALIFLILLIVRAARA